MILSISQITLCEQETDEQSSQQTDLAPVKETQTAPETLNPQEDIIDQATDIMTKHDNTISEQDALNDQTADLDTTQDLPAQAESDLNSTENPSTDDLLNTDTTEILSVETVTSVENLPVDELIIPVKYYENEDYNSLSDRDKLIYHIKHEESDLDTIENLLVTVDINSKDEVGQTLLFTAINHENVAVVTYFIQHGADVNAKDNNGVTPLLHTYNTLVETICMLPVEGFGYCQDHFQESHVIARSLIESGANTTHKYELSNYNFSKLALYNLYKTSYTISEIIGFTQVALKAKLYRNMKTHMFYEGISEEMDAFKTILESAQQE